MNEFTKQQMKFFEKAGEVALTSAFDVYHLGCVAVLKNRIIAASPNKLKTHPLQKELDNRYRNFECSSDMKNMHSLHAEIACLSMIKDRSIPMRDIELYIVRIRRDGNLGLARPCNACMNFIISKGIRKLFYSTNFGYAFESVYNK